MSWQQLRDQRRQIATLEGELDSALAVIATLTRKRADEARFVKFAQDEFERRAPKHGGRVTIPGRDSEGVEGLDEHSGLEVDDADEDSLAAPLDGADVVPEDGLLHGGESVGLGGISGEGPEDSAVVANPPLDDFAVDGGATEHEGVPAVEDVTDLEVRLMVEPERRVADREFSAESIRHDSPSDGVPTRIPSVPRTPARDLITALAMALRAARAAGDAGLAREIVATLVSEVHVEHITLDPAGETCPAVLRSNGALIPAELRRLGIEVSR